MQIKNETINIHPQGNLLPGLKMATVWIVLAQFVCIQLISGAVVNVALKKPVKVSSRFRNRDPGIAVNGNTTATDPCCVMHTAMNRTTAWWWVDLQTQVQDATVKIYFRTNYSSKRNGVMLYTSATPFSNYPSGELCHTVNGSADGTDIPDVVSVNCTGTWRYLMVYTSTNNDGDGAVLDFGEVQVLGCDNTYGVDCDKSCDSRQCAQTPVSCDRYTGACPAGGCKAGWIGIDCTQACPSGSYGSGCNLSCRDRKCRLPSTCDHVTGQCVGGCLSGWNGTDCRQECPAGTYGYNCRKLCSMRKCVTSSGICDRRTGVCPGGCRSGWMGEDCRQACPSGSYGSGCNLSCGDRNCRLSSTCYHVTGQCVGGCLSGWTGIDCKQECTQGTNYGAKCSKFCSARKCRTLPTTCDPETGQCPNGCQDGWTGEDCTNACLSGSYGSGCNLSCEDRNCGLSSTCYHVTGRCAGGCLSGWTGIDCKQACPSGSYGSGCNLFCGDRNCRNSSLCHHVTGQCVGGCLSGWNGTDCKQECTQGTNYGAHCSKSCSARQCRTLPTTCDPKTGQCPNGCQDGWTGEDCTNCASTRTDPVVAGVIGAVICAVLMVVLCGGIHLCLVRYGRLKWSKVPDHQKQSTEMGDITSAQVTRQTVSERSNSDPIHSDYAVLDVQTVSNNKDYDIIKNRVYENT